MDTEKQPGNTANKRRVMVDSKTVVFTSKPSDKDAHIRKIYSEKRDYLPISELK